MVTFKTVNIRDPNSFVSVIGSTGTASQIPPDDKWCNVPVGDEGNLIFVKEFIPHYEASSIEPPMEYWLKFGLVIVTVGVAKVFTMKEVVEEHGEEAVKHILWHSMGNYRNSRWLHDNCQIVPSELVDSSLAAGGPAPLYSSKGYAAQPVTPEQDDIIEGEFTEVDPKA